MAEGHMEHFKKVKLALFYTKSAIVGSKTKNRKKWIFNARGEFISYRFQDNKGYEHILVMRWSDRKLRNPLKKRRFLTFFRNYSYINGSLWTF